MVSEKLAELLNQLEARERAATFDSPGARLRASLYELDLDDEELTKFVLAVTMGSSLVSGPEPFDQAIALLTIGLELGRELERRNV